MLSRKLGKRALLWGALAQNLPDIDTVAALWLPPYQNVIVHRGFTHSVLFALVVALLLAVGASRWQQDKKISWGSFFIFFLLQFLVHDLLDTFNAYGTGLLEPFSHERFAFHLLYVADPLLTIWPAASVLGLVLLKNQSAYRWRWVLAGLLPVVLYISYAAYNKSNISKQVQISLAKQQIRPTKFFVTPTPFNNWLWYAVAATDSGYYVAHRSVFWPEESPTSFQFYPQNRQLLAAAVNQKEVQSLLQFADGYYTLQRWNEDTLAFNVLRFGQMSGWQEAQARFAFHYFLTPPEADNTLVMQRGRLNGWTPETVQNMLRYIFTAPDERNRRGQQLDGKKTNMPN